MLNNEAKEMLIDYILESKQGQLMDQRYTGFESIIIQLVREGIVLCVLSNDRKLDDYLNDLPFVEHLGYDQDDTVQTAKYRLLVNEVIKDVGFKNYVHDMIIDTKREIKQHMKDIKDLNKQVESMECLVN